MPSLEALYNQLVPSNFLITQTTTSAGSFTSPSSTPSLDQISSAGSRSSTPFMLSPFAAFSPHSMLSSGENSMALLQYFQQSLLNINMQIGHTGGISSPNDLQRPFIKCRICLAAFPTFWLLEQHTILQHSGQPPRRLQSSTPASAASSADNGSTSSREDKPFQCEQCGQSYRYRSAYLKHREQNHRARLPADKLFTCDICGMQFRYLKSFRKHRLNHTFEVVPNIGGVMGTLRKDFKGAHHGYAGQHQFQRHLATVAAAHAAQGLSVGAGTATGSATSVAPAASPGDQSATTVSEMQVSSSNEVESNATSTNIGSVVKEENVADSAVAATVAGATPGNPNQSPFNIHYPTERPRDRQLFACSFCSKTVRSKENLKLHVRKHTGERPFACLFCGRAFGGKSDLTRHVRIHTGERPYHCEMCGKCFARADYLSKHLTTHLHNSHSAARSSAASTE